MRLGSWAGLGALFAPVTVALAVVLLGPADAVATPLAVRGCSPEASGFPSCVPGTYLGDVALVEDPPFLFRNLNTLGADGTLVTESTVDFGAGGLLPFAYRSGGRGHWQKIGHRKVRVTYLHFVYDENGVLSALERISGVVTFNRGCTSATGEATYSIYLPDQDPFGADEPIAGGIGRFIWKRIPPK